MNAIELKHVTKSYKEFSLQDVNLVLPQGSILGLVGENGAGKSTTIKLILDIVKKDGGEIKILGKEGRAELIQVKEEIGVVMDEACFPVFARIKDINRIMKSIYQNWEEQAFFDYTERFGLSKEKKFSEYSKGMKMKLAIAVALSHQTKLLILDEATSGLDPIARDEMLDIFFEFIQDGMHSILISSHIISDLEKICDYVAFIHKGKILVCDEKDRLLEYYGILKCSNEEVKKIDQAAIHGKRENQFGTEALVEKSKIPSGWVVENARLEDIIVYLAKGERR